MLHHSSHHSARRSAARSATAGCRAAFTLVELLVAITIFSILITLAIGAFRETDQDRAAAGAQQLRSMLEGARSRAISDQGLRGIRLILDPNNRRTATAIVYIAAGEQYHGTLAAADLDGADNGTGDVGVDDDGDDMTEGTDEANEYGYPYTDDDIITYWPQVGTSPEWYFRERNGLWRNLRQRKLLTHAGEYTGARICIPEQNHTWYPIVAVYSTVSGDPVDPIGFGSPTATTIKIAGQYPYSATRLVGGNTNTYAVIGSDIDYILEFPPRILPGSTPQPLPAGIAIDLDGSSLPSSWTIDNVNNASNPTPMNLADDGYGGYMDVLFSPRGDIAGDSASKGVLNFIVANVDAIANGDRYPVGDQRNPALRTIDPTSGLGITLNDRVVTVFTRTGLVTTARVNHENAAYKPYWYGLTGKDAP